MSARDDRDWARLLAGGEAGRADPRTKREAHALRRAVLGIERDQPPADPVELDRLMFRLRQEGLLEEPVRAAARPWSWQLALAASVMVLGIGAVLVAGLWRQPPTAPGDELNVDAVTVQVQLSADPRAARDALARELTDAGLAVTPVDENGHYSLRFRIEPGDAMRIRPLLGRHGLSVPVGGEIVIEFRQRRR